MTDHNIPITDIRQPGEPRPERKDAAENRIRILRMAAQLFADHGVAAVSMADIAAAAGVGKGTLYRRFANKGELSLSLMDRQLRDFQEQQLAHLREEAATGVPFLEQLEGFLDALVRFTETHIPLLCEVQEHGEHLAIGERPHYWQYMTAHGLLQRAEAAGELPAGLDLAALAEALLAPLGAATFRFQVQELGFTPDRIAANLRTIVAGLSHLPR